MSMTRDDNMIERLANALADPLDATDYCAVQGLRAGVWKTVFAPFLTPADALAMRDRLALDNPACRYHMMRNVIIAIALMHASAAHAQGSPPPPQYDVPYKGKLTVYVMWLDNVSQACLALAGRARLLPGNRYYGCATPARDLSWCHIYLPRVGGIITQDLHNRIRRHELGHCNGWRH